MYRLGIDVGAATVAAASARDGRLAAVPLGASATLVPSVVHRDTAGTLRTGEAADRRGAHDPAGAARGVIRLLLDPAPVALGGRALPASALLAATLHDALSAAVVTHAARPDRVVLTRPARWEPFDEQLYAQVPAQLGLGDVTLVADVVAAAAHHGAARRLARGAVLAVLDLGDGADAALVRLGDRSPEVLGAATGVDGLAAALDDAARAMLLDAAPEAAHASAEWLRRESARVREALSAADTVASTLPGATAVLRRSGFEERVRPGLPAVVDALGAAFGSAGLEPGEVTDVVLVGGLARTPCLVDAVRAWAGRPVTVDPRPQEAAALGAAMLAVRDPQDPAAPAPGRVIGEAPGWAIGEAPGWAIGEAPDSSLVAVTRRRAGCGLVGPDEREEPDGPGATGSSDRAGDLAEARDADDTPTVELPVVSDRFPVAGPGASRSVWPGVVLAAVLLVALLVAGVLGLGGIGGRPDPAPSPGADAAGGAPAAPAPAPPALAPGPAGVAAGVPDPSVLGVTGGPALPGEPVLTPNGRLLYVSDPSEPTLTVIDTLTRSRAAPVALPGVPARFLTASPDGRRLYAGVFAADGGAPGVVVIDTVAGRALGTIPLRSRPFAPAVSGDGRFLWVPQHDSGSLAVVDTAVGPVGAVVREIGVGASPHAAALAPDGARLYVSLEEPAEILELDPATDQEISRVPTGAAPYRLALHPTRPLALSSDLGAGTLTAFDTLGNVPVATIPVGNRPQGIAWAPDGRRAYVAVTDIDGVAVIDTATWAVTGVVATPARPTGLVAGPDGRSAFVTCADAVTVLDLTR